MPEWQLPAETASVPLARRLATDALTDVPQRTLEVVALVVSELVTNCLRHAGTDLHLKVTQRSDHVQVEVSDHGRGRPARKSPPPSVAHGRGLQIVQALTRGWGVVPAAAGAGKTVWCSVAI
jgi:signal transduction histidine kinase